MTVTWSENLDQTQAVPGTLLDHAERRRGHRRHRYRGHLFGREPDAVHALERRPPPRLARTHLHRARLQPEGPRHRTRRPAIRAATATLTNASITNNTTNATPTTPTLVSPADAARLNTADADADRDVQRPRHSGHRQGHLRGLLDEQLLELARHLRLDQHHARRRRQRQRRRPRRLRPRERDDLLLAREERRLSRRRSSFSAIQSFIVDTAAPTMSSATVAANGTTRDDHLVGEPRPDAGRPRHRLLDHPERRRRRSHGTATAVTYPRRQPDAVHALEHRPPPRPLALTYTAPGCDPEIRDTAPPTGNAAATATSATARSPTTPRTRRPASRRSSARPTPRALEHIHADATATFGDPDTQDTGKVTFQVCTTSDCSELARTFDSTSTNLAVSANGSAASPAASTSPTGRPTTGAPRTSTRPRRAPRSVPSSPSSSTPPRRR